MFVLGRPLFLQCWGSDVQEHLNVETTLFEAATPRICSVFTQEMGAESLSEGGEVRSDCTVI